jgi:hypothetical protein
VKCFVRAMCVRTSRRAKGEQSNETGEMKASAQLSRDTRERERPVGHRDKKEREREDRERR